MSAEVIVSGLAGRYATALFDLALEAGAVDRIAADLAGIEAMVAESADLQRLLASPLSRRADQRRAVLALADAAGLAPLTGKFLGVLADNRRLAALTPIAGAFARLVERHRGEVSATVTTATALDAGQVEALKASLKATFKADVKVDLGVDPSLLGGMIVKVASRQVDSSIRSKLNRLKVAMKGAG